MTIQSLRISLDHDLYFDQFHLKINLPPPPKPYIPSTLEVVWMKICEFFRRVGEFFGFWKNHSSFKLTDKQIKLIEQAKDDRKLFDQKIEIIKPKIHSKKQLFDDEPQTKEVSKYPEEKTLKNFCVFVEDFSQVLIGKCINEEKIQPIVPELKKKIVDGIDQVKKWVELIVNLKNAAAPLFKTFGNFDDPLLTILAQQLLQVLLQPIAAEENPKQFLEKALTQRIKTLNLMKEITDTEYEKISSAIEPALRWLLNSKNWLINSPHPILLHHFIVDSLSFLDSFSKLSKQGKLDELINKIKEQIDQNFTSALQELLNLNIKPIANTLALRFSQLIQSFSFNDAFNEVLKVLIQHLDGWIEANAHKSEQELLIANAKHDSSQKAKNLHEIEKRETALKILEKVKSKGGEAAYLEDEFHHAFSKTSVCHPEIQKMIRATSKKSELYIEDQIYDRIIDDLLPSLLPQELVILPDDSQVEISGIAKIIKTIQYPEVFKNVFSKIQEIINLTLEDAHLKNNQNFEKFFQTLREIIITHFIHQHLKDKVKEGLQLLFEKFTSKEYLDELIATHILPPLIQVIFLGWVRTTIQNNTKNYAPIFHKLIEPENDYKLCSLELTDTLYTAMGNLTKEFNLVQAGFAKEKFREMMEIPILEIKENLLARLKNANPEKKISLEEVHKALDAYLKEVEAPFNPLYGELTMKALFKIGDLKLPLLGNMTETVVNWFKASIIEQASAAFHDVSSSYHLCISSLTTAGKANLLNPPALKLMLFPPPSTALEKEKKILNVAETLKTRLEMVSALTHDILYKSFESMPMGSLIKKATPSTSMIFNTITSVINKLFKSTILNKNLLVKIFDVASKTLTKAGEQIMCKGSDVTY